MGGAAAAPVRAGVARGRTLCAAVVLARARHMARHRPAPEAVRAAGGAAARGPPHCAAGHGGKYIHVDDLISYSILITPKT